LWSAPEDSAGAARLVDDSANPGAEIAKEDEMSDEPRKDEEIEVEGHSRHAENEEPAEDETEDEVEAHVRKSQPRHI
jgi:hypothetical protein